jgi:hypothetical protein
MASAANNHSIVYGSGGILEIVEHARKAYLILAA